ncbi:DUF1801 domain-containing protein [Gilvibacter sediminis]|uniref:DUF1801 domain-containing protein n=1 Tax=Gilvibacter sediminis TaxID=379071 RepID=UPI002350D81D|nr:DUF1801 domain-containing protein [Gilvibacter sediminis]MDC7999305.1 DUF1801 domain-containing protein [Gilvibacter sediminis]
MKVNANTVEEYFQAIPEERQPHMKKLHQTIVDNLPEGFQVGMSYGMVGYVVPHSLYPAGYHCDPKLPLPFMSIASQKNFIALYHMGIYANPELLQWFQEEYPKHVKTKLDMGKSCIRFKKPETIPYDLIAQLCRQMDPQKWIDIYESVVK